MYTEYQGTKGERREFKRRKQRQMIVDGASIRMIPKLREKRDVQILSKSEKS